jgi:uncharacterized protein
MVLRRSLPVLIALVSTLPLYAAETPIPESPTRWVTDTANFLSPETVQYLDRRLDGYQQDTGHQLIVYIAPTTGDAPIEDWAVRAFAKWKVGRKGSDDGLALFIMTQDHKMRIEVGYGREAVVPDAIASRVIREVMAPRIRAGHPDDAVKAAIDTLTDVIGGVADALPPPRRPKPPMPWWARIFLGFIGLTFFSFFVSFIVSRIRHRPWLNPPSGSGGGGGRGAVTGAQDNSGGSYSGGSYSGGSDSGGFDGGGGESGGGGASGDW